MLSDFRFAFRQLTKSPGFTIVSIVTLALGIGVNTSLFSGLNTFLFRAPPYPEADRIVRVYRVLPQSNERPLSPVEFLALQADHATFDAVAAFTVRSFNLGLPGEPAEQLRGFCVSPELFQVYGVAPLLGRVFRTEDDRPGRDRVVVLGYQCWQTRFAADPNVVGRTIRLDGENVTVIGVMPRNFDYPPLWGWADVWRPLALSDQDRYRSGSQWLRVVARLQPGVPIGAGQRAVEEVAAQLARDFPQSNAAATFRLVRLQDTMLRRSERQLTWLTMGLAAFVLLIACANLANLHLARSIDRGREYAIRAALGASRLRLVRQILVETLVLAFLGASFALLLALWGNDVLARLISEVDSVHVALPIDWRVIGFAFGAALAAGAVVGLVPAWLASRAALVEAIKRGSAQSTPHPVQQWLRQVFVAAEIAFALVLLAGAGMMLGGVHRIIAAGPGWRTVGLLRGEFTLPDAAYGTETKRAEFVDRLRQRLAALPEVERVTLCSQLPIWGFSGSRSVVSEGRPPPSPGHELEANQLYVDENFFSTLDIPLREGRSFAPADRAGSQPVAIINRVLAERLWPNAPAIGQRFSSPGAQNPTWIEVVGVVENVRRAVPYGRLETAYELFFPLAQSMPANFTVTLRSNLAPEVLAPQLRQVFATLDPDLPLQQVMTVQQSIERGMGDTALVGKLLTAFSALGLLLASIGLYAMMAGTVARRTREIGIRMALGATKGRLVELIMRTGVWLAICGSATGLLGAWALARLLATIMPELPAPDIPTILGMTGLLVAIVFLASWVPARRATQVNPVEALRAE